MGFRQRLANLIAGSSTVKTPPSGKLSSLQMALPKTRTPLKTLEDLGINYDLTESGNRGQIREWCRGYYATHPIVGTCIDIYSRFPVQDFEIKCKNPELQDFYEDLFLDENRLNYNQFLVDMGREFWTVGEVTTLASFNQELGVWTSEEILNPDDLEVLPSAFSADPIVRVYPPQYLQEIFRGGTQSDYLPSELDAIKRKFPNIGQSNFDSFLDVDASNISRIVNKVSPWDLYGTPHLLRVLRLLMTEESLSAAQDAVANRLYAPFILAKLGLDRVDGGEPWIPDFEDLEATRDQINEALAADFRLLVHHYGLDIRSVFGRESMPRLDNDFDRVERKILQAWGIGESLLSGSSNGSYASSALNMQLVTQLMTTYQKWLQTHFRRRAAVIAEAQGHYDYELSGNTSETIYEEALYLDPDTGETYLEKKPKLLIPELKFKTLDLKDEESRRNFLFQLKRDGIPISDELLVAGLNIDLKDEADKVHAETVAKAVSQKNIEKEILEKSQEEDLGITEEEAEEMTPPVGRQALESNAPSTTPPGTDSKPVGEVSTRPSVSNEF